MMRLLRLLTTRAASAALSFVLMLAAGMIPAGAQDGVSGGALLRRRNLSDVPNKAAARTNLGITSATVDYAAPFTGGATQTINAKLAQRLNVKDFGAQCDGTTPDDAAIQAAASVFGGNTTSAANGLILEFPRGVCVFASPWTITNLTNLILQGQGSTYVQGFKEPATKIRYTGTASPFLSIQTNYARGFTLRDITIEYANASFTGTLLDVQTPAFSCERSGLQGAGDDTSVLTDLYTAQNLLAITAYEAVNITECNFKNAKRAVYVSGISSGPLTITRSQFYTMTERFIEIASPGNFTVNLLSNFFDVSIDQPGAQISGVGVIVKANGFAIIGNHFGGYTTRTPSDAYLQVQGAGVVAGNTFRTDATAVRVDSAVVEFSGNSIFAKKGLEILSSATIVRGGGNSYNGLNTPTRAVDVAPGYASGYAVIDVGPDTFDSTWPYSYYVNLPGASSNYRFVQGAIRYAPSGDGSTNGPQLNASIKLDNLQPTDIVLPSGGTLTYAQCGQVFSNSGATGATTVQLPAARIGCSYTMQKVANQDVTLQAQGGESFMKLNALANTISNTAGAEQYAEVTVQGHYTVGSGQIYWRLVNVRGTW